MADKSIAAEPAAICERRGAIAIVTLNCPRTLNAVNGELATAVGTLIEPADTDSDVRAIVITGAGRAFSTVADLRARSSGEPLTADGHANWGFAGYAQHWENKPTIAAVNGFAFGGGPNLFWRRTSPPSTSTRNLVCQRTSVDYSPRLAE